MLKRYLLPVVIFVLATVILVFSPSLSESFRPAALGQQEFARAQVIEVLEQNLLRDYRVPSVVTGDQRLNVRILEGSQQGAEVEVHNSLNRLHNVHVAAGDRFILMVREGAVRDVHWAYNHDRAGAVYWMLGLMVVLILLLGKMQGLNSLISLYFTGALVIGVLIPGLFAGWHPVLLTVALMALKIVVNFLLVAGYNRKSLVAMLGTLGGVIVAGVMAQYFGEMAQLNGLYLDKGEDLIHLSPDNALQIRWLLFVAIMISALGAVMDVAISMASSYHELREANPQQPESERLLATINIGRDIMGTMTNTLILAFAGSSLTTIMMVWGFQMPLMQFMNIPAISLAMIHALAGSIGLILTIPFTVICASVLYNHPRFQRRNG
ncbi:YibE/F family protein [Ferrimonas pelagia]|uniref:YibE/F family protein n=1 Tax=Ferrimonas pelagia TaxID=1177826 RepID=A0ABP9EXX9_9GAMM